MPSTTTSSLTIGSIFDLIGVGASVAPTAADSSGFDSLLQSPRPAPPPSDRPPENAALRTDQDQHGPAATEATPTETHSPSDQSHSDDPDHEPTAQSASKNQPPPPVASQQTGATPLANPKPHQETEQVDAQSLAALAAVNSPPQPALPKPDPSAGEEATADPKAGVNFRPAARGNRTVAFVTGQPNSQDSAAANDSVTKEAEKSGGNPPGAHTAPTAAKQQATAAKAAEIATTTDQSAGGKAPAIDPLLATESETSTHPGDPADPSASGAKDQHRDNAHTPSDASTLHLESALTATTPDAASTGSTPPAIAPIAAQTQLPDSLESRPSGQPATSIANGTPAGQRSRLPADVLAPAAQTTNRRPAVEIDSARLLTRVARAVTTAQERDGEVHLRLSPPELGSLRLDVKVQDGALVAHLQTETDAARTAILDNLPALRDRLADQGVRIERFDVDLMQRQPGGMADQPGGRQQEPTPPEARVVLPPRATTNPVTPNSLPSVPRPITPSGGLNVIV